MHDILKDNNLKRTLPRQVISKIIKENDMPMSAQLIYEKAKSEIDINLSTVYRALNTLTLTGALIKQVRQDGIAYYQENKVDHVHLLICSECNCEISVDVCPLEKMFINITKQSGFKLTGHSIELYGLCPKCQA